jgi:hypothetical protein
MDNNKFETVVKSVVVDFLNHRSEEENVPSATEQDVFIVWLSKILNNNKALAATYNNKDNFYFEVTYNGATQEVYLDVYTKKMNFSYGVKFED